MVYLSGGQFHSVTIFQYVSIKWLGWLPEQEYSLEQFWHPQSHGHGPLFPPSFEIGRSALQIADYI